MRIAVLHQAVAGDAAPDDRDVLAQADAVGAALTALGHRWERCACTLDLSRTERWLAAFRPDLVFNLVESLAGTGRLIHLVPALLDAAAIPYTGAATEALIATSHKLLAKERLAAAGLPTPPWIGPLPPDLPPLFRPAGAAAEEPEAPWLLKSLWEHASIGLDAESLVRGAEAEVRAALAAQAARTGGACFAEKYIEGREFNLSLLAAPGGPEVLPPAEILFEGFPPEALRIVGYRAKWEPDSFEYRHTVRRFEFPAADDPLLARLRRLARRCWELFGLHGYARVDFRVDARGEPWILEVNANPCLSPDAGFAAALAAGGIGFAPAVGRILEDPGGRGAGRRAASAAAAAPPPEELAGVRLRRTVAPEDAVRVRELVAATGHFYPVEVAVAVELVEERLAKGPACGYDFVFAEAGGALLGYACFGPVPMAPGSFDLYWIAVAPSAQKRGVGRLLLEAAESAVRRAGGARLYAETSGRPLYAGTRGFYERTGFFAEARLEDFYGPGDPKIIYAKRLAAA
jgi:D-alanine-D-alanine ligase-like ATP-grasp enzyme/GNAT superfamily N-acetyltransferase